MEFEDDGGSPRWRARHDYIAPTRYRRRKSAFVHVVVLIVFFAFVAPWLLIFGTPALGALSSYLVSKAHAQEEAPLLQPENRVAFITAGYLAKMCHQRNIMCRGYIAGILDAINNSPFSIPVAGAPTTTLARVCTTKDDGLSPAVKFFQSYMINHPEIADYSAASGVAAAMQILYPCASP